MSLDDLRAIKDDLRPPTETALILQLSATPYPCVEGSSTHWVTLYLRASEVAALQQAAVDPGDREQFLRRYLEPMLAALAARLRR